MVSSSIKSRMFFAVNKPKHFYQKHNRNYNSITTTLFPNVELILKDHVSKTYHGV